MVRLISVRRMTIRVGKICQQKKRPRIYELRKIAEITTDKRGLPRVLCFLLQEKQVIDYVRLLRNAKR